MNLKEAVFTALGELGDKTSIKHLQARVKELINELPNYQYTYKIRQTWRKDIAGGLKTDARKHADIPRRNMLNDQLVTPDHVKVIFRFFTKSNINPEQILELINDKNVKFHSLEQLITAIQEMQSLQLMFTEK